MGKEQDDLLNRLMGTGRYDQLDAAVEESAKALWAMYQANLKAGFTEAQAFQLCRDWHTVFTASRVGLVVQQDGGQ